MNTQEQRNSKKKVSMLSRPLLTLHEVSELLKVKEATVRTWINQGALRAIKFDREWRVSFKDLEHFVESRATAVVSDAAGEKRETKRASGD
jgi:excisionase family DNA binding protein